MPLSQDLLSRITNVHWNKLWLYICSPHGTAVASQHDYSCDVSFPELPGGSPGFSFVTDGVTNSSFREAPFSVTANDMKGQLLADGGAKLHGINAGFYVGQSDVSYGGAGILIKMPPTNEGILRIRFNLTNNIVRAGGPQDGAQPYVYLFDAIPPDFEMLITNDGNYDPAKPHPSFAEYASMYAHTKGGLSGAFDFTVNTKTLRVDADQFDSGDIWFPPFP
jgi:hypothetical protein